MRLINYINPFSNKFHAYQNFCKLSGGQKALTIVTLALVSLATLGIGSVPIFRLMVHTFSKLNTIGARAHERIATRINEESARILNPNEKEKGKAIETPDTAKSKGYPDFPDWNLANGKGGEGFYIGRIDMKDLTKVDSDGFPPLLSALDVSSDHKVLAERIALLILEKTLDPNPETPEFASHPIIKAIDLKLPKVVQKMVDLGVDKEAKALFSSVNVLDYAKKKGNEEIIAILEKYFAE